MCSVYGGLTLYTHVHIYVLVIARLYTAFASCKCSMLLKDNVKLNKKVKRNFNYLKLSQAFWSKPQPRIQKIPFECLIIPRKF